ICGEYHRARILEVILKSNEARVFCIDYGRICKVHFSGIYFLKTDFADLPAQAIRCQLHNIAPKLRNRIWPRSACTAFKEMVNRKDIKMKIVYVNWDEECTGVLLTDITDVDNTYNVNEEMVNKGFGYWENQSIYPPLKLGDSTSNVERLYFFPMFLELELGFAQSASEMYTLEELGVPVQFCLPQYFSTNNDVSKFPGCIINQESLEYAEQCFIETIRYQQKYSPLTITATKNMNFELLCDFNFFRDLKHDLIKFNQFNQERPVIYDIALPGQLSRHLIDCDNKL
ncbi:hypothetical protein GWI33_021169, partial [Rhynchophorus ferrugineus]